MNIAGATLTVLAALWHKYADLVLAIWKGVSIYVVQVRPVKIGYWYRSRRTRGASILERRNAEGRVYSASFCEVRVQEI